MAVKRRLNIQVRFLEIMAGNPQYLIFIGRDITERKQAEAQIQQEIAEREKNRGQSFKPKSTCSIVCLIRQGDTIEIFDPDTMAYIKWNKACTELTGYSDEEFAEMNPRHRLL